MKWLTNLDLARNELQNVRLQNLASAPINPVSGQIYYNTTDSAYYGFNGMGWINIGYNYDGETFTAALLNKLNGIAVGATKVENSTTNGNIKIDGAEKTIYIHPNAHPATIITEDSAHRFVTDVEKSTWNAKANTTTATTNADGLMTKDDKAKLNGISTGANKALNSATNGNITIDGTEQVVYTHPTGTNPHGTTKSDIGLGTVENKSSATIRGELVTADINKALGFTPKKVAEGLEIARPTAAGSLIVYIAIDTKKIWFDQGINNWVQIGGQDTIDWSKVDNKPTTFPPATHNHDTSYLGKTAKADSAKIADGVAWGNVSGKPSLFAPPIATTSVLGGIKVGANLSIGVDGTLNANDNPTSYLIKQEKFIAAEGQKVFNLTRGSYRPMLGALSIFLNGVKISNDSFAETSTSSLTLKSGLSAEDVLLVEYIQLINVQPYPVHANEHLSGGADPIPLVTISKDGLMASSDKTKLNNSYTSVQVDNAISIAINNLINGAPGALDTLIELSSALGNDPNFATTITNQLATKVDKINGKGLSTEDFTTVLLNKLNGIATGAQTNQNAFSNVKVGATIVSADSATDTLEIVAGTNISIAPDATNDKLTINNTYSYIHPASHAPSMITQDASNRFVSDIEKATWNSKASTSAVTTSANGLMTSTDKTKLDGIAASANNYTHPNDSSTRHVTDSEKALWNAKPKKYAANIGDGKATAITVAHNLNTSDITVSLLETASPYNAVITDWQGVDVNSIKLLFAVAPTSGQYRVVVIG